MREHLIHYVDLLFAGAPEAADIKQEILQNTLDRYDDLVSQGKNPQAAYSLAIAGIGDVSELLGSVPAAPAQIPAPDAAHYAHAESREKPLWKKVLTAIAIFLYIIAIIPLLVLSEMGMDVIGLCGTISIVAVATVAIIAGYGSKQEQPKQEEKQEVLTPRQEMKKAIKKTISTVGLVVYFVISFATGAWYITWLIFPIVAAIEGVVSACLDLKEAKDHET